MEAKMIANQAKRKMLAGQPALGAVAVLGTPLAPECYSLAGYDFVIVDNQHGEWTMETSAAAFRAIAHGSATPMARAAKNDFFQIGGLLDRGALGIVVPMVNSAAEAAAAAFATRYVPRGGRSVGPFGAEYLKAKDYVREADEEIFLAVQIETPQAVDQAEAIMATPGVDGCWIGPMDLALCLGVAPGSPNHEAAIMRVLDACRKTGKIPGIYGGADPAHWLERGFLFVTVTMDTSALQASAQATLTDLSRFRRG
jgi:4-hydroxy-2-oxoheptanedioate aldolase